MSKKYYPAEGLEQIVKLARKVSLAREFEPTEPTICSWIAVANGTVWSEAMGLRREFLSVVGKGVD